MKYDGAIYLDPGLGPNNPLCAGRPTTFSWLSQHQQQQGDCNNTTDMLSRFVPVTGKALSLTQHSKATNNHDKGNIFPTAEKPLPEPIPQAVHEENLSMLSEFANEVVLTDSPKHLFDMIALTNNPERQPPSLLVAIDLTQYYTNHNNSNINQQHHFSPLVSARSLIGQIYLYFHHLPLSIVAISQDGSAYDVQLYSTGVDFVGPNPLKRENLEATLEDKALLMHTRASHVARIKLRVGLSDNKRRQNLLRHLIIDGRSDLRLLLQFNLGISYTEADLNTARARIIDWNYDPFDLSYDELVLMALAMFQWALTLPELEPYRLEEQELLRFLVMMRDTYHHENPYHNFRHAIDVMQATFHYLIRLGCLPAPPGIEMMPPMGPSVFTPAEALVTLIAAIGHDISHPGVTNAFLVSSRSPMAQVFNDKSVLESYHACVLNRVLNIFWPATQQPHLKRLIVESVLATDMAQHFSYVDRWNILAERCDGNCKEERANLSEADKQLVGSMIMKCADVSNVARKLELAEKWGQVLQQEFSEVRDVETDCNVQTLPPNCGPSANLAQSQVSFLNIFAYPLFKQMADALPEFGYAFNTLQENKTVWESRLV